jgi:hypothetical protein
MRTITITTHLDAEPEAVRKHVMMPELLNYAVAGFMKFQPIQPDSFPLKWSPGSYRVRMLAFHVLPVGWQKVSIELPERGDDWFIRDNGSGSIARVWDHLIFVEPEGSGSRYVDQVRIDAGILTWIVKLYAILFYRHRQRRWRKLVDLDFRPLASNHRAT